MVIFIGAALAAFGAYTGTCAHELFMVASAIIGGEMGLSRSPATLALPAAALPPLALPPLPARAGEPAPPTS